MDNINLTLALKRTFGFDKFRPGQERIIRQVLDGRATLGILPTGAGKSVCYQLPASLSDGLTLVISPLIALMKDQVDSAVTTGIPATFLNSTLDFDDSQARMTALSHGDFRLLFVAPERFESEYFVRFLESLPIELVAIDEAHCISQWGHDFRPSYLAFAPIIKRLPSKPVLLALTATATARVAEDIRQILDIPLDNTVKTGFLRENLRFEVVKNVDKRDFLKDYLKAHREDSGIIYATTRKDVEQLTAALQRQGYAATRYHAGLTEAERAANQEDFIYDRAAIMVATNAFGMGINKSNVRFVIHYSSSATLEAYYQEAGRAGRDGLEADAILLFSLNDMHTRRYFIEQSETDDAYKAHEYEKLRQMQAYANTEACLQRYILRYFGDEGADCGKCSNCTDTRVATDITTEAQKVLSCVVRMDERFGKTAVAQVLTGSRNQNLERWHFERLTTFGIMKNLSQKQVAALIDFLTSDGYLGVAAGQFPTLFVTDDGRRVLRGEQAVARRELVAVATDKAARVASSDEYDATLFERLRVLRLEIAKAQHVPPFMVFSDAALRDMTRVLPHDDDEFLAVSGVGAVKLEKYGDQFLAAIDAYLEEKDIE